MAGIYLHIPFCKQACNYCNFHFSTSLRQKDDMLAALSREMALRQDYLQQQEISTVYWGGGTPSLLSSSELMQLWDKMTRSFNLDAPGEVTLEANPDNLSPAYLKALAGTPVNRLSIGIQSFREEDLRYMNRAHTAQEADYAVKAAQDAGFENISIDLIYGTPTMNDQQWKENIHYALGLGVPHISSYALTVEPRTALAHAIEKGRSVEPDNEQAATQFELLMDALTGAGYDHYEISNFALPGRYAVHNTNYWRGAHYIGLGPSAHSFDGGSRQWNVANNALYLKQVLTDSHVPAEREELSFEDRLNEYLMTSLRTMWGTDLALLAKDFGSDVAADITERSAAYRDKGCMLLQDGHLVLTPAGKLLADRIASELFYDKK
ncbi:radical SAM family heme chaperone HemW [Taibaiella chishuiensis]|nr:radical SAM family heme chaperone HemW [Taibaiella chishuiensis]